MKIIPGIILCGLLAGNAAGQRGGMGGGGSRGGFGGFRGGAGRFALAGNETFPPKSQLLNSE